MTTVLERAGASFLRAFGTALLFLIPGILNAPDEKAAVSLAIAAFAASIAAGIKAVQTFVPQLSWASFVKQPLAALLDSFTRMFVAVFLTFWQGWLAAPDWVTWKSAGLAAVIAAATAGVRAVQGLLTTGEWPAPSQGFDPPS